MLINCRIIHLILLLTVTQHSASVAGCRVSTDATPVARQGDLDLSALDLQQAEPIRLDEAWEFYWKQLLNPADFKTGHPPVVSAYLPLPAAWNDTPLNGKKRGKGLGIY